MALRTVFALLALLLSLGAAPRLRAEQLQRPKLIRPIPVPVQRAWASVKREAASQNWSACLSRAREFLDLAGDSLVPITDDHLVAAELAVDLALIDSIRQHQVTEVPVSLLGLASAVFSAEELLKRGDAAWLQGDLERARRLWRLLQPAEKLHRITFPAPIESSANVYSRLALLERLERHPRSSQHFLSLVERTEPSMGRLAGREGIWADLLRAELADPTRWPAATTGPDPLDWSSSVTGNLQILRRCPDILCDINSDVQPVSMNSDQQGYLLIGPTAIRWIDEPSQHRMPVQNVQKPTLEPIDSEYVITPVAVREGDRIYASVNPQFVHSGLGSLRPGVGPVTICLQADSSLSPHWQRSGEQIMEQPDWFVSSTPVVQGAALTVALRSTGPEPRLGAAQLDRQTGEVLWRRTYGSLPATIGHPRNGQDRLVASHVQEKFRPGEHTPAGLVLLMPEGDCLGLSSGSGRLLWLRAMPSGENSARPLSTAAVIHGGDIIALSPEGRCECLSLVEGATQWKERSPALSTEIVGICDDVVLVAGRNLRAIRRLNGTPVWASAPLQRGNVDAGSAILFGHQALWSTTDQLWLLDAFTGHPVKSWLHTVLDTRAGRVKLSGNQLLMESLKGWNCFEVQAQATIR